MKYKAAFSLIETIFIIMIIGILALVAIPRLSATYDDAKISVALNSLGTLINDLSTFYTTKDFYSDDLSSMTHISDVNYTVPWNNMSQKGTLTFYVQDNNSILEDCVLFELANEDGNLTISSISNPTGDICKGLQKNLTYKKLLGTKLVGGNRVKF